MKKYLLLFAAALVGVCFTACDGDDDKQKKPGTTENHYIDATADGWHYFSLENGELVGSGAENETDNAEWFARKDWDFAVNDYFIRTNSGDDTATEAKGGIFQFANESTTFSSVASVPENIIFATDKFKSEIKMGGKFEAIQAGFWTIRFKLKEDGSPQMPPVFLRPYVYIIRSADGLKYYKVEFTQYQNEDGAYKHIKFDAARIYK